jgi:hypothetical protein
VSAIFYGASKRQRVPVDHAQCLSTRRNHRKRHDFPQNWRRLGNGKGKGQPMAWFVFSHIPRQAWTERSGIGEFIAACKRALALLEVPKSRRAAIDLII